MEAAPRRRGMMLVLPEIQNISLFFRKAGLSKWLACCLAVYIGMLSGYAAAMPCQKKTPCRHGKPGIQKTCPAESSHRHLNPCKLVKAAAISTAGLDANPFPKTELSDIDVFSRPWDPAAASWVAMITRYRDAHASSPPLFLLKESFLC